MKISIYILPLLIFGALPVSAEYQTVLKCGRLIDVETQTVLVRQLVTIESQRISSVRSG